MQIFLVYILIIIHYSPPVLSVKVSACAQWNKKGITVAGIANQPGNSSNQLNKSRGIFIRKSANTLYVADTGNNRIQMFTLNQSSMMGITVASTETSPYKIYIDEDNGPTIYISLPDSHRVEKWIDGALSGIQVGSECYYCDGIAVDKGKNVYMVESQKHRVIKWFSETNSTTIVAGVADRNRSVDELLLLPAGIYLDKNDGSLYVADCFHERIQKWPKDGKKGITVAGSLFYKPGEFTNLLSCPSAVIVDEEINMIYVVDAGNDRIQRWSINASEGETIAGRSGSDEEMDNPSDLAFDNEGNLYVCVPEYHHVQMFTLTDNRPCAGMETETITTTPKNRAVSSYGNWSSWLMMAIINLCNAIIFK